MKVYTLEQFTKKQLKKADFKHYYDRELLINEIASIVYNLRVDSNLTQAQLAKKVGTSQSSIARLESGADSRMPSIDLLARIVAVSNAKLKISLTTSHKAKT